MRLFDRVSRLVKSDAHGIIDQLEERDLLLKQHLRDAEIEVADKRARAESLEDEQRRLREEADRLAAVESSLDEDVELAIAGDKDELARFAVAKLLPVRAAHRDVKTRIVEVAASRDRLAERLAIQEQQLADLTTRVRASLAETRRERAFVPEPARLVSDEEVELELLRRAGARGESA
jgi:phage shock protein A